MVLKLVCGMLRVAVVWLTGVEGEDGAVEVVDLREIKSQSESLAEGQG